MQTEITDSQILRSITIPSNSLVSTNKYVFSFAYKVILFIKCIHQNHMCLYSKMILKKNSKEKSNWQRIEDGFRELLSEEHFDEEDVPCRQCNRRGNSV